MEEFDLINKIINNDNCRYNNDNLILESILGDCYHIYCNPDLYPFSLMLQ